jgi:predicted phosphodiesterase
MKFVSLAWISRSASWQLGVFGAAFITGLIVAACAASGDNAGGDLAQSTDDGGTGPGSARCLSCTQDSECAPGNVCAQFSGDSFCVKACPGGNECASDMACTTVSGADGKQSSACLPKTDVCGPMVGPTGGDAGGGATSSMCGSLAGPDIKAGCSCTASASHGCQANGCYGGWYCNTATSKCQAPPASCGTSGGGNPVIDAGGPLVGSVGNGGGSISRLYFAVIGDTRPPIINDTSGYPTAVITRIYQDLEQLSPRPPFAVSTGDYLFSTGNGTQAAPQLALYQTARKAFSNPVFPAMGNHECTGAVTSNCGAGNADGMTNNYSEFLSQMLAPMGQSSPNYVINVNATNKSWTSKFVFVAGNAWTSADATWLEKTLAVSTTYTFIVRHEPKAASNAPAVKPSEAIMANHPYTLAIVGHTHTYGKTGVKQVTIGNGGAPLVGAGNYGYGLLQQRSDGAIQVDMIDYATGKADPAFKFALNADGSAAP